MFERLKEQFHGDRVSAQRLLIPFVLEVGDLEASILRERTEDLSRFGFEIEPLGERSFAVHAVPTLLKSDDPAGLVLEVIGEMKEWEQAGELQKKVDEVLSTIACHSAIRAHKFLDRGEVSALLMDMDRTQFSNHCPHGRPVSTEISQMEIERMFRRR